MDDSDFPALRPPDLAAGGNRTARVAATVALVLLVLGGFNWALVGLFNLDFVAALFGTMTPLSRIVYVAVGVAALYGLVFAAAAGAESVMADALAVLAADHRVLQQLLAEFDELAVDGAGAPQRQALATRICQALTAHAVAEEDVFYPALRQALQTGGAEGDVVDELLDDALVEHDGQRALVEQIETMDARHERFDALVIMLARAVARHVSREEDDIFPQARQAGLDLQRLGRQIARRRDEALLLLSEIED